MLRRRRRSEAGQTLIATLAFIAFFGVVSVAALSWASATQKTVQNTEVTASGNSLGEGVAAFASANASRGDAACDPGGVSQMFFADGDNVLLQTKGCGTGRNTQFGATSGSGSDCQVCLLDAGGTQPALTVNSGSSFLGSSVTVSGDIDANGNLSVGQNNSLSATPYGIALSGTSTVGGGGSATPTPLTKQAAIQDPLGAVQVPILSGSAQTLPSASATLSPGVYGLNSGGNNTISGTVTLNSGLYVFTRGLTLAGGATLQTGSGQGALLYFACSNYPTPCSQGGIQAGLTAPDPGSITLNPPATGAYAGMSIMFDRGNRASISLAMGGSFLSFTTMTILGTVYAPASAFTVTYASGLITYSTIDLGRVIADHMAFGGGGGFITGETTNIGPPDTPVGFESGCAVSDDVGSGTPASGDTDLRTAQPRPTSYGNARVVTETGCGGGTGLVSFDYGDTGAATTVAITPLANNGLTNDTTPTLPGTATDYVGTATVTVEFCSGTTAPCTGSALVTTLTTTAGGGGAWSVTPKTALPSTCAPIAPSTQNGCVYTAAATLTDSAGNTATSLTTTFTDDTVAPAVVVNPASTQANPTSTQPIVFTAIFSDAVTGFTSSDVSVKLGTQTVTGASVTVTPPGQASVYTISVSGLTGSGAYTASIPKSIAQDLAGNSNAASTGNGAVTYNDPVLVSAATVADSSANYAGYIHPGATYYVYANASSTAGAISSVGANVSNLSETSFSCRSSATNVSLTYGSVGWFVKLPGGGTTTYHYRSAAQTAGSDSCLGSTATYTVTATDGATNSAGITATANIPNSLTVTVSSSNKGTIVANSSYLTFTFDNQLNPSTVTTGAATVTFSSSYSSHGGLQPTTVSIPGLTNGPISTGGSGWVNATSTTTTATATYQGTLSLSANNQVTFTITGMTCSGTCGSYVKSGARASFTPTPATTIQDIAGNGSGTGTASSSSFYIF